MDRIIITLVVAALLAYAFNQIGGSFSGDPTKYSRVEFSGTATKVRDGDTIEVSVPIRIKGLHCPERGEAGGPEAAAAMSALVEGAKLDCTLMRRKSYDRVLGWCDVDGRDWPVSAGEVTLRDSK